MRNATENAVLFGHQLVQCNLWNSDAVRTMFLWNTLELGKIRSCGGTLRNTTRKTILKEIQKTIDTDLDVTKEQSTPSFLNLT